MVAFPKILVLNSGSSSIKCSIYDFTKLPTDPIWEHKIEWKNIRKDNPSSLEQELRALLSNKNIDLIGHRIVHGGRKYQASIRIDENVKKEIRALTDLAPLHNLADLMGIEVLEKLFPRKPQVAVFDTAFHHTLAQNTTIYPGPYAWFEKGIQRYGFHGISFQYCTKRATEMLSSTPRKMIICHLGSGASLCAVFEGKSIDTTMGFTPLEGLMMDTRSGTIDPGILLYLLKDKKKTPAQLEEELYEQSGLLGLSGISSDMRDVLDKASSGHLRSQLAIDVYIHRLACLIGSMAASLGGLDTLVFTAGIGENSSLIREKTCSRLAFLGVHLSKTQTNTEDCELSSPSSQVKVLRIHTKEAYEIAKESWKVILNTPIPSEGV